MTICCIPRVVVGDKTGCKKLRTVNEHVDKKGIHVEDKAGSCSRG